MGIFSSSFFSMLAVILVISILVIALFMGFYRRSTKEQSFVRTGVGGQHVVLNGGAFVFPIVHALTPVNMNTQKIVVQKIEKHALITKDHVRVDTRAEFHIRVEALKEQIAIAARTLGAKTMSAETLKEQIEGFCEGALRSAAAEMELMELHENRQQFSEKVEDNLKDKLLHMGLELVSVTLTSLDQTDLSHFPEDNALNVGGITYVKKQIAMNEKRQNELQQDKEVAIAQKNHEALSKQNAIKKMQTENKLLREKEIRYAELEQKKQVRERELRVEQEIEGMEVAKEIVILEQGKKEAITRSQTQKTVAESWIETDKVKAQAAEMAERVTTYQEKEIAERSKIIELISANKEADRHRIIATGTADAEKIEADAAKMRYAIEAAGKEALNKAANLLSNDQISLQVKQQIVNQLPSIIRESVKPIENIDGIKIVHVDGLTGNSGGGAGGANNGSGGTVSVNGSLADQVVDSALRYKAQAPLVESLLKEVGIDGGDIKTLTKQLDNEIKHGSKDKKKKNGSSDVDVSNHDDHSSDHDDTSVHDHDSGHHHSHDDVSKGDDDRHTPNA